MTDTDPSIAKATLKSRIKAERSKKRTDAALVALVAAADALERALHHWGNGPDRLASRLLLEHIDEYLEERN